MKDIIEREKASGYQQEEHFFSKFFFLCITHCVLKSFIYLFYFWLRWVFIDAHRLSVVVAAGRATLSLWCVGFPLLWLLLLWNTGSRHAGFSSCHSQALEQAVE